jgi:hypothetical protein
MHPWMSCLIDIESKRDEDYNIIDPFQFLGGEEA